MDYEKKYKESLGRARKWYNINTNKGYREIFEDIFHELKKESEGQL